MQRPQLFSGDVWWISRLALCALSIAGAGCRSDAGTPDRETAQRIQRRPNIIFVMIDTLRADAVGAYGNPRNNTPTIDRWATEGVLFERVITAAPWTQPSIASIFCSYYPTVHKVTSYRQAYNSSVLGMERVAVFGDQFETLAELLSENGYATAGFVANPFMYREYGFAQGFDHFDTSFAENDTHGDVVNEAAFSWLDQRDPSRPFFLFLHYMDVHGPYNASPELLDPLLEWADGVSEKRRLTKIELDRLKHLRPIPRIYREDRDRHDRLKDYREYWVARYEAGARQMDLYLAQLQARLESLGVWEDALLVVMSDHGEALCEIGIWEHGYSVHESEAQVPLILRWPEVLPADVRVAQPVRTIDLMPTLLDGLGLSAPDGIQGRSLIRLIAGDAPDETPPQFIESVKLGKEQKALYLDGWKLTVVPATDAVQLCDLGPDPDEQRDLSRTEPEKLKQLSRVLLRQLKENMRLAKGVQPATVELSREQRERLNALGYSKEEESKAP